MKPPQKEFKAGDKITWHDPDDQACSRSGTLQQITPDESGESCFLQMTDGWESEVLISEISLEGDPLIVSVSIGPKPEKVTDPLPEVTATFQNGTTEKLFSYYPDEIQFEEEEFIGLDKAEAMGLKFVKSVEFLRK